jgi:hypothetical protein
MEFVISLLAEKNEPIELMNTWSHHLMAVFDGSEPLMGRYPLVQFTEDELLLVNPCLLEELIMRFDS